MIKSAKIKNHVIWKTCRYLKKGSNQHSISLDNSTSVHQNLFSNSYDVLASPL